MANTRKITQEFLFDTDIGEMFSGIAFRGDCFYLLEKSGNRVIRYNRCFEYMQEIELERNYNCICHGDEDGCFWAASKECPNLIFCLNGAFQKIGEVHILPTKNYSGFITGLSYNCRCKTILVAYTWGVLEINPETEASSTLYEVRQGTINGVLSVYPGSILIQMVSGKQSVIVLNQYNEISQQQQLPTNFAMRQMIYCPCGNEPILYCLMNQNTGKSKVVIQKITFQSLGFQIDSCYHEECGTEQQMIENQREGCKPCPMQPVNILDVWEEFSKNCDCENNGRCQKAQIMESVAMSGAAISHILNAEGEKLQKVLACTDDFKKIICVNKEISRTIVHVTHLEQVLYSKLLLLEEQCCRPGCCGPCPKPCRECNEKCRNQCDCKCENDCSQNECSQDECSENCSPCS